MKCKECEYCKQTGRQQSQRGNLGRKRYYCEHKSVLKMKDKYGYPINNFVGYGDMTIASPLTLKTNKKWCPLKEE